MAKVRIKQLEDIQASDVYLERDLKVTAKVGEIKNFDPGKQYATVSATRADGSRKTLQDVLEEIFCKDNAPKVTQPNLADTRFRIGEEGREDWRDLTERTLVEARTNLRVLVEPNLNPGAYQYGPATGCTMSSHSAFCIPTINNSEGDKISLTDGEAVILTAMPGPGTFYRLQAGASHTAGATPLTQLGSPAPESAIKAGSVYIDSAKIVPALPVFYGFIPDGVNVDGPFLRSGELACELIDPEQTKLTLTLNASPDLKTLAVAVPKGCFSGFHAQLDSSMGAEITQNFNLLPDAVEVPAYDMDNSLGEYDVYLFYPDEWQGNEIVSIQFTTE